MIVKEMMRIQKIIANSGFASRRQAEKLIIKKQVLVNGQVANIGDKASPSDVITINGKLLPKQPALVYYVLNKPMQTITSLYDPQKRQIVRDLIDTNDKIFPVGRLDYNTTGVLLLTNDGEMANRLMHPSFEVIRVYRARVSKTLTKQELAFLNSDSVVINNKKSTQKVTKVANKSYVISLHQGTNHHVKNLFKAINKRVITLTRIEFAGITAIGLKRGESRKLKPREIKWLKKLTNEK